MSLTALHRYLPAATWQLELFLALFSTLVLLLLLTHRIPPLTQLHLLPHLTLPISALLLVDSYLELASLERRYAAGEPGSTILLNSAGSGGSSGWTLNARRFREQRDCYLAFFTIVLGVVIRYVMRLNEELTKAQSDYYRGRTALDARLALDNKPRT